MDKINCDLSRHKTVRFLAAFLKRYMGAFGVSNVRCLLDVCIYLLFLANSNPLSPTCSVMNENHTAIILISHRVL